MKIYRHGNYTVSGFSNHITAGFPAGAGDGVGDGAGSSASVAGGGGGEEEAVDDLLHLLSPFALSHNKGSVSSFSSFLSPFFLIPISCVRILCTRREGGLGENGRILPPPPPGTRAGGGFS